TFEAAPEGQGARIVQSWDLASAIGERNDYSVCVTAVVHKQLYYIVDVWRGRREFPELKRKIVEHAQRWKAHTLLIEDAGPGLQMLQMLRNEAPRGCPRPIGVKPQGDKEVRMEASSAAIEQGSVFLPKEAPWLSAFLEEILAFPNARNDDQVDAFSQLLNWAARRGRRPFLVATRPPEIIDMDPAPHFPYDYS
ncbi:MAG: phage terminase large subunit, partial [Amphiplicatus sp.]